MIELTEAMKLAGFVPEAVVIQERSSAPFLREVEKKRKRRVILQGGKFTPEAERARASIKVITKAAFVKMRGEAVRVTQEELGKAEKLAKAYNVTDIVNAIMLALAPFFDQLSDDTKTHLEDAAKAGVAAAVADIGITNADVIGTSNEAARAYAADRAAEMVGMKFINGQLVPNPNARWQITDTTRTALRNIFENAFAREVAPMSEIVEAVRQAGAFSDSRAETIARTEVSGAQQRGVMNTWRLTNMVKTYDWLTSNSDNVCSLCTDMADGGPYDFGSGPIPVWDSHPNCQCVIVADEIEDPYPVSKGDFEGHPFRGNQWKEGEKWGDPDGEEVDRIEFENRSETSYWLKPDGTAIAVSTHISSIPHDTLMELRSRYKRDVSLNLNHYARVKGLIRISGDQSWVGIDTYGHVTDAQMAALHSLRMRYPTMGLGWGDKTGNPREERMVYDDGWDSFFEHHSKKAAVEKGDYEGHPFRGNQWTGGRSGIAVVPEEHITGKWIGVDLDGTLAHHESHTLDDIGKPIKPMVNRVKQWLKEGKDVRIFTARAANPGKEGHRQLRMIREWCREHIGTELPITNIKDHMMEELWDDRARHVERNTGIEKGDYSGHPFRGNQYAQADSSAYDEYPEETKPTSRMIYHDLISAHNEFQNNAMRVVDFKHDTPFRINAVYAWEHRQLTGLREKITASLKHLHPNTQREIRFRLSNADMAMRAAEGAHERGRHEEAYIAHDEALWEMHRGIEEVRRSQWKVEKGDVEGHPFRGNQYTDVAGSEEAAPKSNASDKVEQDTVYGTRPSGAEWDARILRDKLDTTKLRPALATATTGSYGSVHQYKYRVWAYPVAPKIELSRDANGNIQQTEVPAYATYRYRRDGKIERSWVSIPEHDLEFEDVQKGDFEGHPFRGNQWTSGETSGATIGSTGESVVDDAEKLPVQTKLLLGGWTDGDYNWKDTQTAAREIINGTTKEDFISVYGDDEKTVFYYDTAKTLLDVVDARVIDKPLYRGLTLVSEEDFEVGETFSESLTSWTGNEQLAGDFTQGRYGGPGLFEEIKGRDKVLMILRGTGMHGINVSQFATKDFMKEADEYLTTGEYCVISRRPVYTYNGPVRVLDYWRVDVARVGSADPKNLRKLEKGGPGSGDKEDHPFRGNQYTEGVLVYDEGAKKWHDANGSELPEHIGKLHINPQWTDVRYNPDPNADLLVSGRDGKGHIQGIYSERFKQEQAEKKFGRVAELDRVFDKVKEQVDADIRAGRNVEEASCLRMIMNTGLRPDSDKDTKTEYTAYGATTLKGSQIVELQRGVRLRFVGKSGVYNDILVTDPEVAKDLLERKAAAGPRGQIFKTNSVALSAYAKQLGPGGFKTKDFRTLAFTRAAQEEVAKVKRLPRDMKSYKKACNKVADTVSARFGNTRKVALQSYIHPIVFSQWRQSAMIPQAHFGKADDYEEQADWREALADIDEPDTDTLLDETPPEIVGMLGFDPLDDDDEEEKVSKGDLPGHEFRGNQYTAAGEAMGDVPRQHSVSTADFSYHHELLREAGYDKKESNRATATYVNGKNTILINEDGSWEHRRRGFFGGHKIVADGNNAHSLEDHLIDEQKDSDDIGWGELVHVEKGGAGSGNYGHEGRPGEVGGSGPGGGTGNRSGRRGRGVNRARFDPRQLERWRLNHERLVREGREAQPLASIRVTPGMTREQAMQIWQQYRERATDFRNEGNLEEWGRHYNIGRRFYRYAQESGAQPETPSPVATQEQAQQRLDESMRADWDTLISNGKVNPSALDSIRRNGKVFEDRIGVDPGTFFNSLFAGTGMDYEISSLSAGTGGKTIGYGLYMYVNGEQIGYAGRILDFSEKTVYHGSTSYEDAYQGKGHNRVLFANSMRWYERLGMERVTCSANCSVGGYAWAKYGYKPSQSSWDVIRRSHPATPEIRKIFEDSNPEAMWAYADTPQGKRALLGAGWSAELNMKDHKSMLRFKTYTSKGLKG